MNIKLLKACKAISDLNGVVSYRLDDEGISCYMCDGCYYYFKYDDRGGVIECYDAYGELETIDGEAKLEWLCNVLTNKYGTVARPVGEVLSFASGLTEKDWEFLTLKQFSALFLFLFDKGDICSKISHFKVRREYKAMTSSIFIGEFCVGFTFNEWSMEAVIYRDDKKVFETRSMIVLDSIVRFMAEMAE